jgi:hypothetical protein
VFGDSFGLLGSRNYLTVCSLRVQSSAFSVGGIPPVCSNGVRMVGVKSWLYLSQFRKEKIFYLFILIKKMLPTHPPPAPGPQLWPLEELRLSFSGRDVSTVPGLKPELLTKQGVIF